MITQKYIFSYIFTYIILFGVISYIVPEGILRSLNCQGSANFSEMDVSQKPTNWTGVNPEIEMESVQGANLRGKSLRHANCYRAFLVNADFRNADLRYTDFEGADLRGSRFENSDLSYANLRNAQIERKTFKDANIYKARMHNPQVSVLVASFAKNWPLAYYDTHTLSRGLRQDHELRLETNNLSGYNIPEAYFWQVNLDSARFDTARVTGARFIDVSLKSANFDYATLCGTKFMHEIIGCDLSAATFHNSDLQDTDLRFAFGLKTSQLDSATLDHRTQLPDYLIVEISSDSVLLNQFKFLDQIMKLHDDD